MEEHEEEIELARISLEEMNFNAIFTYEFICQDCDETYEATSSEWDYEEECPFCESDCVDKEIIEYRFLEEEP